MGIKSRSCDSYIREILLRNQGRFACLWICVCVQDKAGRYMAYV